MFRVMTEQQTNQSSFAGVLELILNKNKSETLGRNNECRVTKDF